MDDCLPSRAVVGGNDTPATIRLRGRRAGEQAVPGCISRLSWERVDPHVPGCPYVAVADGPAVRNDCAGSCPGWSEARQDRAAAELLRHGSQRRDPWLVAAAGGPERRAATMW
jgi:hypothetical protein